MKIISGAQTGVDRAALDVAINLGIDYGGSVPKGRRAEDGQISAHYDKLTELETDIYEARTQKNVLEADATVIFTEDIPTGGTAVTLEFVKMYKKQYLTIDLKKVREDEAITILRKWLHVSRPEVLNIAGPRESKSPGIYVKVYRMLNSVFGDKP